MWIERTLLAELLTCSHAFPAVVLTGPRQVGKTSLLQHAFPDANFVSLDAGVAAEAASGNPEDFLDRLGTPAIIDEIQYVPSLLRFIKTRVDQSRLPGQYILSGSQAFPLMQGVAESLAGRVAVLSLVGLSGDEWLSAQLPGWRWPEFFFRGSYPGLWSDSTPPSRDRWYQGYLATYLERDIRSALRVSSLRDFERFLRAAAARSAQMLNLADLARDTGISPSTAKEWMQVLVASHQIVLLEPYHRALGKRLAKSPKLYFTDPGLAHFLAGFSSFEALDQSALAGAFFENYVIGQWIRYRDWARPELGLWYWRDQPGNEVDLVIESNGRLHPVEIKRKERPAASDAHGIQKFRQFYGEADVGPGAIACLTQQAWEVVPGVQAVDGRVAQPFF
jgi:predicted AAA+ superfamily ATPase